MEQNQNTSLFGLGFDQITKSHLYEAARWARFLAICGFIMLGLMVIFSVYMMMNFSTMTSQMEDMPEGMYGNRGLMSGMGTIVFIFYIIIAIICFFPFLFLLRFANKMKTALESNEQAILNDSFRNLKNYYQYIGILTIIALAFMALGFVSMIATYSMM